MRSLVFKQCARFAWILVSITACSSRGSRDYLDDLVDTIQHSDRIVISEHSSEWDFEQLQDVPPPEPIVYRSVILTKEQTNALASALAHGDRNAPETVSLCMFSPHHTIEFDEGGSQRSRMEICFLCNQAEWDQLSGTTPSSLFTILRRFIKSVGLEPDRDWTALARTKGRVETVQPAQALNH